MLARPGVHIDVHQPRPVGRKTDVQTRLFRRFATGSVPWCFAGLDVAAGLQPLPQPLVHVQYDTPFTDHDGRAGDVHAIGVFVKRLVEEVEMLDKRGDRRTFTVVDRSPIYYLGTYGCDQLSQVVIGGFGHRCDDTAGSGLPTISRIASRQTPRAKSPL